MSYGALVALNGQQLGELAEIIYRQETDIIKSRPFESSTERNSYLEDCGTAYDYVAKIQKAAGDSDAKWKNDPNKGPIAHNILDYAEKALNTGLQIVRNYGVRKSFLEKLSNHTDSFIVALDELDPENLTQVNDLSDDVIQCRDSMVNCMENYNNNSSSAAFSQWVKDSGMSFHQLVSRYQSELGYQGDFKDLKEEQKLEVYEHIIKESGKGNVFKKDFKTGKGKAFFVLLAGMMVWDIFSANHQIEEAARKAVDYLTYVSTAYLESVVKGIVEAALVDTIEATAFAFAAGVITSIVGAFIIGAFAGPLLDLFFGSGGAPLSTEGINCHVAEMPDGAILANQIWSQEHGN